MNGGDRAAHVRALSCEIGGPVHNQVVAQPQNSRMLAWHLSAPVAVPASVKERHEFYPPYSRLLLPWTDCTFVCLAQHM